MRTQPSENRKRNRRELFEIEHERHCYVRLVYDVPSDELAIILQPARRRQVLRTVLSSLTLDFDLDGQMIGVQLQNRLHPQDRHMDFDLPRALRPFKACDNVTLEDQTGYVYVRAWDPYGYEDEVAYAVDAEAELDLGHDGGLIAIRVARTTSEYELDPFSAFTGLPWDAEVGGGASLNQFGVF